MIGELNTRITALELDEKYGKFAIEPLERGFGHTLGNAFRRVLLAHIPGAAVTDVQVQGTRHEFSTLPGVVEDVMEIVLNIKELAIKVTLLDTVDQPEEYVLKISARGETEVLGADVACPPEVEVINPEIHIAQLCAEDAELDIEFWVRISSGYVPWEQRENAEKRIDVIPVDALYSPIKRAAYSVEPTRMGRRTDLDRLVLELWGNGAVQPEEALQSAANVLHEYINVFLGEVEEVEREEEVVEEVAEESNKWLETPIEDVDFSVRTFNCLKKESINALGDLIKRTEDQLLAIRNFGKRSLDEVIEKLAQFDLALPGSEGADGS